VVFFLVGLVVFFFWFLSVLFALFSLFALFFFLSLPLTHGKKLVYRKGWELLSLGKHLVNGDSAFLHL